jgi:thiamine-phosphate pyrophosphorylase
LDGANYIGVGPVFESTTKQFESHVGLDLVSEVAAEVQLPAFAIGGIQLENLQNVIDAGLKRVAVGAAITSSGDPAKVAASMKRMLSR